MGRAPCCDKVGLRKGRWTAEEDKKLREYVNQHGEGSWRSLPKNAGLLRCGKSCRLRWINYLREDLKRGKFSKEEEDTIIKLHATIGNRWSVIAGHLPGRTDNEIKNYWNSHLSRKIHTFWKIDRGTMDTSILAGIHKGPVEVIRRKGGRTSRSNMKKINITIIKNNNTYVVSETRVVDSKRQSGDDSIVTTPSTTSSTITTTTSARVSISDDARRMLNDDDDGNEEVVLDEGLINELLRCIEREENEEDARVLNTDSNDDESLTVGTSLNNEYQVDALLCNGEQEVGSSTSSSEARCQVMTSSSKVNMQDTTEEAVNTFLPRECNSWLELDGTQGNLWEEEDIWPMIWKDQGTGIQSIDTMDDWLCLDGL